MSILSQIQSRNTLDDFNFSEYVETEKSFQEDPLVMSVSLKDLSSKTEGYHYSIDDPRVINNITDDIKDHAEKIRKYYGKKFFWTNLTNTRALSGFRSRACYLLENRIRVCKGQDIGIYYKLPYFYDEDMVYDEFKKQYNTTDVPRIQLKDKIQLPLQYLKTSSSRQQKRNINRFWFTDGTYLYNIEVANDNPLLEIFKQLVVDKGTVTFETFITMDRIDQMWFYKLLKFTLVKEQNEIS